MLTEAEIEAQRRARHSAIVGRYAKGEAPTLIAGDMALSITTVYRVLRKAGVVMRREVGARAKFGDPVPRAVRILKDHKWANATIAEVLRLPENSIAKMLDKTPA